MVIVVFFSCSWVFSNMNPAIFEKYWLSSPSVRQSNCLPGKSVKRPSTLQPHAHAIARGNEITRNRFLSTILFNPMSNLSLLRTISLFFNNKSF